MISLEILPGLRLDTRRALWIEPLQTLVVADLHWGYAASHRVQGNLLPDWGDEAVAATLSSLERDYAPTTTIWLGDSLHTLAGMVPAEEYLSRTSTRTMVLAGNHDRQWLRGGRGLTPVENLPLKHEDSGFFFHHGHLKYEIPAGTIEVTGHHHPALSWNDRAGSRLKIPALVASARKIILPAFSPWAAGTPWNGILQPDETLYGITSKRILAVPHSMVSVRAAVVS